jgi:nucleotide-binding universal stress UspA family protein
MRRPHRTVAAAESQKGHCIVKIPPIKRLLLATDFSRCAGRAEDYACALAASWGADLTVITVVEFQPGLDREYAVNQLYLTDRLYAATAALAAFKDKLHRRGIHTTTRVGTGLPSEEVIAAAEAEDADLVILGTRGKSGLAHVLLGSTAERVIRMAPCPVLAVPMPKAEYTIGQGVTLDRILVPTDLSDCSAEAVHYARVVAGQTKGSIELLHIMEPSSYGIDFAIESSAEREQKRRATTESLEALSSDWTAAGIDVKVSLRGGTPADAILEVAARSSSDLIIMGTHGRRGLSHMWAGSVTEAVLRRGTMPVLAVRKPAFSRRRQSVTLEGARE